MNDQNKCDLPNNVCIYFLTLTLGGGAAYSDDVLWSCTPHMGILLIGFAGELMIFRYDNAGINGIITNNIGCPTDSNSMGRPCML